MKFRLREKFTSEIFYRQKYPDLRYYGGSGIQSRLSQHDIQYVWISAMIQLLFYADSIKDG